MADFITILGCRGSVPRDGKDFLKYGGATSCYAVNLGGRLILVDAGSGILRVDDVLDGAESVDLFLTHTHADHILGLPMCRPAFNKDFVFRVYGKTRDGLDTKAQLNAYLELPNWPVDIDGLNASFEFEELKDDFILPPGNESNPIRVSALEAAHPGGCSIIRFDCAGKSAVVATDCTIKECNEKDTLNFARNTDVLLIDGQYSPKAFSGSAGFGHNNWIKAAEFGKLCGAKKTVLIHHDPFHTDDILDMAAEEIVQVNVNAIIAREGEIISL